jgi:alpha-D-ribose 1-methylphosphonate 5-triphosphate synthase subunit PhnH
MVRGWPRAGGVDLILVSANSVAALPRSVHVMEERR